MPGGSSPAFGNGVQLWENPYLLKKYGITPLTVWMASFSQERSITPHRLGSFHAFPGDWSPWGCQPSSFYQPLYSHEIKTQAKPNQARHPIQTAIFLSNNLHHLLSPSMSWDPADGLCASLCVSLRSNTKSGGCQRRFAMGKQVLL